ncbi:3'-5' exonuclease [Bacillus alkalicellulosilyticus]|uniref:3'-5' exonuclease n=1 Tax=Alkalihalobacterium alkalicellulosilyticum TaxID=1912214 RepID=UPI001481F469|nr:3'-5' exonuclease [Bacillus alkalicellulosilyticus]
MNAVVFDLELVKRFKKGQLSEIVEIGACKINIETKEMTSQFQIYILPAAGYISKSTRKFINMTKEDAKRAVPFKKGIETFIDWLGDHYYLCSWGKDDKIHLLDQCVRNRMNLDWLKNYNDIQKPIGKLLRAEDKNQLGLKTAIDLAGIEAVGKAHRGIDDAINTGLLLQKYIADITLEENKVSKTEINKHMLHQKRVRNQPKTKVPLSKNT